MNRRDILAVGFLVLGMILYMVPYSRMGVDIHHDGILLKSALDVLSGQVLFRDSFMQYGALTCYLQVVALWVHPSLLALKLLTIGAYAVAMGFFYASWRLILPRSLAILSCILLVWFIPAYEQDWPGHYWIMLPWSSVYAMSFQAIALFALLMVIRAEKPEKWGLILGLSATAVFWCRQPVGIVLLGCIVLIWFALLLAKWNPTGHSRRKIATRIFLGFALLNFLMIGEIWLSGATADWWYQNFVWPKKWALSLNSVPLSFLPSYLHPISAVWMLLLVLVAGIPALMRRLNKSISTRATVIFYLCLAGVIAWQHEQVIHAFSLRYGGWTLLIPLLILSHSLVYLVCVFKKSKDTWTTENYLVAAIAVISLGSALQYFPLTEPWHILWALGPCFGLVIYQVWRWVGWSPRVVAMVTLVALLPALHTKVQEVRDAMNRPMVTLSQPRVLKGMMVSPKQEQVINRIWKTLEPILELQPNIPGVLIGRDALVLCLINNLENPTPYFVTWSGLADDATNQRRWDYIKAVRPLMFLQEADWSAVGDFYRKENYVPLLYVEDDLLEIAVPKELADKLGVGNYGVPLAVE